MAINIISTPHIFSPAYNPVEFTFSGNNNTKNAYVYIFDVYDTSNNLLSRQKIAPLMSGEGKADISKIVSSYVSKTFTTTGVTVSNCVDSYLNYYVKIGEEYQSEDWTFTTSNGLTSGFIPRLYGIRLTNTATTHTYISGDYINITNSNATPISLNGVHKIINVPNSNSIDIGKPLNYDSSGVTQYADYRKVTTYNIASKSGLTVFNGVETFGDFISYSGDGYILSGASTSKKALTDLPNTFYATRTQDIKLNTYIPRVSGFTYYPVAVDNLNNTTTGIPVGTPFITAITQFNVGPTVMNINSNATYYDVHIVSNNGPVTQLTKKYRIYIDNRCKIEDYEIAFMDRKGSINSFAFQLKSLETGNVERTQYNKELPNNYNTYDAGEINIFINLNKELTLNTNWMTEEMSIYFEQLETSPYTWVKINGIYYACTILDTSFENTKYKNQRLIKKTVKIRLSNKNSINI